MEKRDYSKSKIRNWLNKKLLKKHYIYKKINNKIYQIEYHHFYYIAYYDKPTIRNFVRCLKNNHYIVWDCFENYDIENSKGTRCQVDSGCFKGFFNTTRKTKAKKILDNKSSYWETI